MNKKLYTGFSFLELLWTIFLRLLFVIAFFYTLPHYDENPTVITAVLLLCFILVLTIGDDEIVVYGDRITQHTNSFATLLFRLKGNFYKIEDIKKAYLEPLPAVADKSEIAVAFLARAISPRIYRRDKSKPIYLSLKNDKTVCFYTKLEEDKLQKIVGLLNSLIDNNTFTKKLN